jgi:hypothetical protein
MVCAMQNRMMENSLLEWNAKATRRSLAKNRGNLLDWMVITVAKCIELPSICLDTSCESIRLECAAQSIVTNWTRGVFV